MASNSAVVNHPVSSLPSSLMRALSLPWLDRTIAAIACVPLVYLAYYRYQNWHHGFPLLAAALNVLILVATMIVRRPPNALHLILGTGCSRLSLRIGSFSCLDSSSKGTPLRPIGSPTQSQQSGC